MPQFSRKSKILTVSGGKGGTGKTFLSVNMAVEMANRLSRADKSNSFQRRNRVLLFDADFHLPNAHLFLGQRLVSCLDHVIENPGKMHDYIIPTKYGIDLISFGGDERSINTIETTLNSEILAELKNLERSYDWIIIDTSAGLDRYLLINFKHI